jgi:hypothetical protein
MDDPESMQAERAAGWASKRWAGIGGMVISWCEMGLGG